jgi:hypothetical protein
VQCHSRAWELTTRRFGAKEVHYLYYDEYASRYNATLKALLTFARLQPLPNAEPLAFDSYKTYKDYFSPSVRQQAKRYVQSHAQPQVWERLSRYFDCSF